MDTRPFPTTKRPLATPAFLHLDLALMVWVILGPIERALSADLDIGPMGKSMLMAMPILAWSILRLVAGLTIDRMKPGGLSCYRTLLEDRDAWWFMLLYAIGFGGLVGLASIMSGHLDAEHGLDPTVAAHFTATCVLASLVAQPMGGLLVGRVGRAGGLARLSMIYLCVAMLLLVASLGPSRLWMALALFAIVMFGLSLCNGALIRMLPPRLAEGTGAMTALFGMAGAIGGAYLAVSLGYSNRITGSHATGLLILAALAMLAATALTSSRTRG